MNDTLLGVKGSYYFTEKSLGESSVKIPVEDMNNVEVSSFDPLTTAIVIGTVGLFLLVVALTINFSPDIHLDLTGL